MKLRVDKAIYGGNGLARIAEGEQTGKAVFVPSTLPGELVEVSLRSSKKGFAEAELVDIIEASSDRVQPQCKHFGACGGCQYQHANYPAQLAMKQEILKETLQRARIADIPEIQIHAAEPWQYRNRVRMRIENHRIGYNRRASNIFLPIEECPISAPILWKAAQAVSGLQLAGIPEVEIFTNQDQSAIQVTLFALRGVSQAEVGEIAEKLKSLMPETHGVGVVQASREGRGHREVPDDATEAIESRSWGSGLLQYTAARHTFDVQRGAFFQINRYLLDELVRIAVEGRSGNIAWDLYAGVGLFSAALLRSFTSVTAVEIGDASSRSLTQLMSAAGNPHRAMRSTTLEYLRRSKLPRPDLIVVDPPRAGIGSEVVERLNAIAASQIVYISCDPATLSRDLAGLLQSGYTLAELHLVDLFPQTFHLETVAVLQR